RKALGNHMTIASPGADSDRSFDRVVDLTQKHRQRALRLRFRDALEADRENESVERLRVDRSAENRADAGGAHGDDLFTEGINQLLLRGREIEVLVRDSFEPRL